MKRHAKAASGRFAVRDADTSQPLLTVAVAVLACVATLLIFATSALAATVTERPLLFTFRPTDQNAELLTRLRSIAVDDATGSLYLFNDRTSSFQNPDGLVAKFDANGASTNFSALGSPTLCCFKSRGRVAVNNSGGAGQSRLYVSQYGDSSFHAFEPSGDRLWTQFETFGQLGQLEDIGVDTSGHPWTNKGYEYANTGSPPEMISSLGASGSAIDVDANGNVYLVSGGEVQKYTGGAFDSTLDPSAGDVYADQSSASGHIFTLESDAFSEFDAAGSPLGTFGENYIGDANAIAYNPTLDRVYVTQFAESSPEVPDRAVAMVAAFGPVQTGTVADATIAAASAVGVATAHFSGTVNPQGTNSEWRFEWKHVGEPWDTAISSPPQSLPVDSNPHAVEFTTNRIRGNSSYEVRLVAVNTANHLAGFSPAEAFTTQTAAEAPAVTIEAPSAVGTTAAKIVGAVNPEGDTADWQVQLSTDPACVEGFQSHPPQAIDEAGNSPVGVEQELTDLLPSETYCARIAATNSAGTTTSEAKQFTTEPIPADALEAIAAAPRLDTSARLNARVNPQGEDLAYRFEYSSDGGSTWQPLPDQVDTSGSRTQKVIATELSGLQPATTYTYRVRVENPAGSTTSQPSSFVTRSTAEVTLPQRGIELVNSPDKGNQNVLKGGGVMDQPPMSEDGEKVIWSVSGGAPGGYSGFGSIFLSERTPAGWRSRSVQPPAAEQIGGGSEKYKLIVSSQDMSRFYFSVSLPETTSFLRIDAFQHQSVLKTFPFGRLQSGFQNLDITDDGSHVLMINLLTGELEDIAPGVSDVVSVMPDGTEAECPLEDGNSFTGRNRGGVTHGTGLNWRPEYHMIDMSDASLVYFEARPNGNCSARQGLYVRDRQAGETDLVDPGVAGHEVEFIRATPDAEHAYFLTYSQLDPADANLTRDVYRWDQASGETSCLTCVVAEAAVGEKMNRNIAEAVLISDDFSHVYFTSAKQLVPGKGTDGSPSLYDLSGGVIRFVAATEPRMLGSGPGEGSPAITGDGNVLVFSAPPSPDMTADTVDCGGQCEQLYRYEAVPRSLECISCAAAGVTTQGHPEEFQMSADGSTIAFKTDETLVRADINRGVDIYEWHGGSRQLITDGVHTFPRSFAKPQVQAISAAGGDILFAVVEPGLTGYEEDELLNLYDARVGGGFERPNAPAHCSEESCQGALQATPNQPSAASSTLIGHGNLPKPPAARRCAKGKARHRGRCVRRHVHKKNHKRARHANQGRGK